MAKGKNANPADAHRKAMKAKEVKKNKEHRKKVRETQTLKTGTGGLEADLRRLQEQSQGAPADSEAKQRIVELEAEIKRIKSTKEKYVAAHPEQRKLVYGDGNGKREQAEKDAGMTDKDLYDSKGRLRDPKRSVYYDPILNPFGVPPPGMPYKEHPAPEDDSSSSEESDSDDDDIVMPVGPPPAEVEEDSDDEITLPDGPAPFQIAPGKFATAPPLPPGPPPMARHPQYPPQPSFYPPHQPFIIPQPTFIPQHDQPHFQHAQPPRPPPPAPKSRVLHTSSLRDLDGVIPVPPPAETGPAEAIISAAPQIRDLRKETTIFVPRNLKKKKPNTVQAAPGSREAGEELEKSAPGGGLMGKLSSVLDKDATVADDYQRFLDGLGNMT